MQTQTLLKGLLRDEEGSIQPIGLTLSKGQGQVKHGHQMKMLRECRTAHVLWVIWDVEFTGGITFLLDPKKVQANSNYD